MSPLAIILGGAFGVLVVVTLGCWAVSFVLRFLKRAKEIAAEDEARAKRQATEYQGDGAS